MQNFSPYGQVQPNPYAAQMQANPYAAQAQAQQLQAQQLQAQQLQAQQLQAQQLQAQQLQAQQLQAQQLQAQQLQAQQLQAQQAMQARPMGQAVYTGVQMPGMAPFPGAAAAPMAGQFAAPAAAPAAPIMQNAAAQLQQQQAMQAAMPQYQAAQPAMPQIQQSPAMQMAAVAQYQQQQAQQAAMIAQAQQMQSQAAAVQQLQAQAAVNAGVPETIVVEEDDVPEDTPESLAKRKKAKITAWVLSAFTIVALCAAAFLLSGADIGELLDGSSSFEGVKFSESGGKVTVTGCDDGLEELFIPDTINELPVVAIDNNAFGGNDTLRSVTIPASVETIGERVFYKCPALEEINVDSGNPNYASESGLLFNKTKDTLLCFPAGKSDLRLSNSVTSIGPYAFAGSKVSEISLSGNITTIGTHAFYECERLENVRAGRNVTSVGSDAFGKCGDGLLVTTEDGAYMITYCIQNDIPYVVEGGSQNVMENAESTIENMPGYTTEENNAENMPGYTTDDSIPGQEGEEETPVYA